MKTGPKRRKLWWLILLPLALALLAIPAGSIYYTAAGGKACIRCHEIQSSYDRWLMSTHRSVQCKECHGTLFTTDVGFHLNNARQLWLHLRGQVPERLLVRQRDISRGMNERCGNCHRQEHAAWSAGPHHATYSQIYLEPSHNTRRLVTEQCLLCHGMFFEGGIRNLVQPIDLRGPWQLTASVSPREPAIPCLTCHAVHRPGTPRGLKSPFDDLEATASHAAQLTFFDRREQLPFSINLLPLPQMKDGSRPVRIAPDARQALCYQCHAPDHTFQVGSGDDRTSAGVHEGLSCFACHAGHDQDARASCVLCHPRLSNCGLDVGTMDTTFRSLDSRHNIHFVKCADCHTNGVPARRISAR
jgi:hypothetical protein